MSNLGWTRGRCFLSALFFPPVASPPRLGLSNRLRLVGPHETERMVIVLRFACPEVTSKGALRGAGARLSRRLRAT